MISTEQAQELLKKVKSLPEKQRQALLQLLRQQGVDLSALQAIGRRPEGAPVALSFAQQRLWFLSRLDGSSVYYNIPMALRLSGVLDRSALVNALCAIVERHEVLRTRFVEQDGVPYQRIDPPGAFRVAEQALDAEADLRAVCAEEALRPFDLEGEGLIRARLLRRNEREHVLLVTMHHSVSDGWSLGVFFRELVSLYGAACGIGTAPLPVLPIQYADYAHWQREWLGEQVQERQLEYWRGQLAGVDPQLLLPTDRPRPAIKSYHGAHARFQCPAALLERLRAFSRRHDVTLYMTLLTVYAVLLQRYSRQQDLAIGTPLANRNRLETENLIGFFVNTLVMRCDLSGAPRFLDLLARVKATALQAYQHQDVPFEAVVDALQLERSLSYSPVFQVMFALQEAQAERAVRLGELDVGLVEFDFNITKFDLTLDLRETPDGLLGSMEYSADLFDRATIERMIGHYCALLEAVLAEPEAPIGKLSMLGAAERDQLLVQWNDCVRYPARPCMHELFEAQVARTPDHTALVHGTDRLSYAELNGKANQLAHYLRQQGVGPDTLVGLCVERGPALLVGLLGIVKAGGAYVPIDPAYPTQRIAHILDDSALAIVLTERPLATVLPPGPRRLVFLDADCDEAGAQAILARQPDTNLPAALTGVSPAHLLYVIYTSGSTGLPKGVLVQHDNVSRLFQATEEKFQFGAHDVWTLFHSFAFDFSVWEMWGALLYGGRLVIVPKEVAQAPAEFYRLLIEQGVTILNQTPSAFERLVEVDQRERGNLSLRSVVFGGEALNPAILTPWFARHGDARIALVNMYGITETTVHVTYQRLYQNGASQKSIVGRKLPDLRLYVLDESMAPVPVGVVGEMYVGGAGVTRGYLNRPELTQARFLPDPFDAAAGGRLYKTGDLARWLPDGNLEFIGRSDHQVKIRGFRIETGEIETQLAACPLVQSCVVLVREDVPGNKQLVAYVVLASAQEQAHLALSRHLRQTLPDYMIPSAYVILDALPLTANGKLDRAALPAPGTAAYAFDRYVAPQTELEHVLVTLWAELLGFAPEQISTRDNFFALGGHSLLITVLVARLKERGYQVSVRAVFNTGSLAELADEIGQTGAAEGYVVPPNRIAPGSSRLTPDMLPLVALDDRQLAEIVASVPGGAANVQDIYPLVPSQQGILFHHLIDPANDPYIIPVLLSAPDRAGCERFLDALRALIARHDVMRTAVLSNGLVEPVQVVYRHAALEVTRLELDPAGDARAQALALLDRPRAMDLTRAPLLQLTVAQDPHAERHFMLLHVHHLIEDASSLRLIFAELMDSMAGRTARLAPPVPYRNFVAHTLHQVAVNGAEAYFRAQLGDIDEPTVPFNLSDVHGNGRGVGELRRSLPPALTAAVREQAQQLHLSPASLFHAAWALVVALGSGRDDVVFGTVLSGRLQGVAGVERMLGNFINTLPLRVRLRGHSVLALVRATDGALKELIEYEQSSLILAQSCSGLDKDVPLFSSMINFRHFEPGAADAPTLDDFGMQWLASVDRTNYPLGISIDDMGAEFSLNVQVDAALDPAAVMGYMECALAGIVGALQEGRAGQTAALELDIVPAAERARQLDEWSGAARAAGPQRCLAPLFEEQVARAPERIAVVYGAERLSYAALNARANQVAHYLRARGAGPDSLIGLCAERSVELVVGLLGILKAGAAYVPLDPAYPRERIAYMLASAGVDIVLTQAALAATLAQDAPALLALDTGIVDGAGADVLASQPRHNPAPGALAPHHLAYLIFTSGSTGRPKGVLVEQRGVARLVCNPDYFPSSPDTVMLQHSSLSFDVGSQEVLGPLLNGGRLVLHQGESRDIVALLDTVVAEQVNTMCLSAAFLPALVAAAAGRTLPLTYLGVGGEAFSARDVRALYRAHPALTIVNAYGPTENSIASTCYPIPRDVPEQGIIPIGKPIAQSSAYILGPQLQLLPVGAVGELCVGGTGVARGYLNHPELSAQAFVEAPFGVRVYRTGDLARWRADGNIEFLGRRDNQVKVRGFRIEPGEIEQALLGHPAVGAAVVDLLDEADGKRLVAYVSPSQTYLEESARAMHDDGLRQWGALFDDTYAESGAVAGVPDFDLGGWNSSYSGAPIDAAQMREWIEGTVERIGALRPRRVLEIGCGSGLLLYRYGAACDSVHAIDLSAAALAGVRQEIARRGWTHVSLAQGDALSLAGVEGRRFDTIVINSVVQYFPHLRYLEDVLAALLPHLEEGGRIFLGDVRNFDLLQAHLCGVERGRVDASGGAGALGVRIARRLQREKELLVSPGWFARLPPSLEALGRADILLKRGYGDNEMLSYRYDVVLSKVAPVAPPGLPWLEAASPEEVLALIEQTGLPCFGVAGLVNGRIEDDLACLAGERVAATAGRWSAQAAARVAALEALYEEAARRGYRCEATWSQDQPQHIDLILARDALPPVRARSAYRQSGLANYPQVAGLAPALGKLLKQHLAGRLAAYMVPNLFVVLEALPLTPNGKLDRRALPQLGEHEADAERYVAPRDALEQTLCQLMQEVLSIKQVGIRDSFFDLGGHSLLATRLAARIRQQLGRELTLRELFDGPSVEQMAQRLQQQGGDALPPLEPLPSGAPAPLSFQQQALWFLERQAGLGAAQHNVQLAYRIIGELDTGAYAASMAAIVRRHAVLRTSYVERDGVLWPVVNDGSAFAVRFERVADEAALAEFMRAEQAQPFEMGQPCMLRVHLLALSEFEHVALLTRPWGVFDGWSTGVLFAELDALYQAARDADAPVLAPLPVQYADFAAWQQRCHGPEALARQRQYWHAQLAGLPARLALRGDYGRPARKSGCGAAIEVALDAELRESLHCFSLAHGVTLYQTLLSAFAVLVGGYTDDTRIAIGSPVSQRPHPDLERLIGYFVNVLVMRAEVTPALRFVDLLEQIRDTTAAAYENQDLAFAELVRDLAPVPEPAASPLFQVMFNLVGAARPATTRSHPGGLSIVPLKAEVRTARFDLNLVLQESEAGLHGYLEYSTDLFASASVAGMVMRYRDLLLRLMAGPEATLAQLRAPAVHKVAPSRAALLP